MKHTAVVVTVSDGVSRGEREDLSGDAAEELLGNDFELQERVVAPDHETTISGTLRDLVAAGVDLIVTTGGTGFGPRDVTPEATRSVIEREAPGLAEAMRTEGAKQTPMAILSRGVAGTARETLIVNLPGSPRSVTENLSVILPVLGHALDTLKGDTSHNG